MKTSRIRKMLRLLLLPLAGLWILALLATGLICRPRLSTLSRVALILAAPLYSIAVMDLWRRTRRR